MCSCYKPRLTEEDLLVSRACSPGVIVVRYSQKQFVLLFFCLLLKAVAFGQQKITGTVSGVNDSPLSGATIAVKGTRVITATNAKGVFVIDAKAGDILIISSVGYVPQWATVNNETSFKISLALAINELDQVVVTGYTAQRVKDITGSVAIVRPKDLVSIPGGQIEQMLQARVAGLNVVSSGQPGGGSNVRLHGIGNFGDVTPLYIIDGIEGNVNNLNPDDIESLQMLKDASAYSIYGVRGANGVVVITTKKGKTVKPIVTYNFSLGKQLPYSKGIESLNPGEEAELVWLQNRNSGQVVNGNPFDRWYGNGPLPILPHYIIHDSGYLAGDPQTDPGLYNIDYQSGPLYQIVEANRKGTDWFHEVFKPAWNQNHSITISAAN